MIDLEAIKQDPTRKRLFLELLINAPEFLLALYGLKCLVTRHGGMLIAVRGTVYNSLHWTSVSGTAAALAGTTYVGWGLFLYFSDGRPPGKNRPWLWRIGRALLRWGSLAIAPLCLPLLSERLELGQSPGALTERGHHWPTAGTRSLGGQQGGSAQVAARKCFSERNECA